MFSKRKDGCRVKGVPYFDAIIPFIMDKRVDAQNFILEEVPYAPIKEYLTDKKNSGTKVSLMSAVLAAYIRITAENPEFNRFIMNKRIYQRNHICISFVVLRNGEDKQNSHTVEKVYFTGNESIFEVEEKVNKAIAKGRDVSRTNNVDRILNSIFSFGFIVSFLVNLLKKLDKHNMLPKKIIDASPFHTSLFLTNMASIKMSAIYHHLYEFGTTSIFIAMGAKQKNSNGEEVIPLKITTDERICSGHTYALGFKSFKRYLTKPVLLENNFKK